MEESFRAMTEITANFVDNNKRGILPLSQFDTFWRTLPDVMQSSNYLALLIAKLLALELNDNVTLQETMRKVMGGAVVEFPTEMVRLSPEEAELKHALLNTIYYVTLYYGFDPAAEPLKVALLRWIKVRGRSPKTLDFVDECLRMLVPGYLQSNEGIISLVEQCSNCELTSDFNIDTAPISHLAPCLINTYLRNNLAEDKNSRLIFDTVLLFLMHPKLIVEPRLLSLLHMLRSFITTSPRVEAAVIEKAITYVRNYYLWPCPYGDVAKDLLQLLTVELKSPGSAMRAKFLEENPELERSYQPTGKERTVHILLDEDTEGGRTFQLLLQSAQPEDVGIHQVQVNLLINILETNLRLDCESLDLEYCSREDTSSFYYTAMEILHQAVLMMEKDAILFRQQKLTILKDYIVSRSTANRRSSIAISPSIRTSNPPPLAFDLLPITTQGGDFTYETDFKYPRRLSTDVLLHILKQYTPFQDRPRPTVLKIGIAGNDRTVHDVVGSYICLRGSNPVLFNNLKIQFYLMPVEHSHIATFLAKNDGWYGRHVLCAINSALRIYPTLSMRSLSESGGTLRGGAPGILSQMQKRPSSITGETRRVGIVEDDKEKGGDDARKRGDSSRFVRPLPPAMMLRTELQNYFREARSKIDLNIYQAECWGLGGQQYYTIPFCMRAVMGYEAQTRAFFVANGVEERLAGSLKDAEKEMRLKTFKYVPPLLQVKFLQMNVQGVPRQGLALDPKAYHSIIVSNIPIPGDRCTPPDPTKPWLEMLVLDGEKKRKTKVADEHIYHVSQVEMEVKDKAGRAREGFHLLLDNILYGPFEKVKIGMCVISKEETTCQSLSIMTYFPLVL